MKILLCLDKFKGSISSLEICTILREMIMSVSPEVHVEICPMADGGDGSVEILDNYLNLQKQECEVVDPLGRPIRIEYYASDDTAYIELASASGLVLLDKTDQNPMFTSTYGSGLQIKHALDNGAEYIYLFLGGSATNDGGMGIANALGYEFYNKNGVTLAPIGSNLKAVSKIVCENVHLPIKGLTLCCDVNNPPFGPDGAAHIYAHQKGANENEIIDLDKGLQNLCNRIKEYNGVDVSNLKGGGAAGGVAICLAGLMQAKIQSGIEMISGIADLEQKIVQSDVVISGEGSLDNQSLSGKVVSGVAELCRKHQKRLWLVVGKNDLQDNQLKALGAEQIYSVIEIADNLDDAISNVTQYLNKIAQKISLHIQNLTI